MTSPAGQTHRYRWLHVVIPARNEEALLDRCLRAVQRSVVHLGEHHPQVRSSITVVLDSCTDASIFIAGEHPDVDVVAVSAGNVGSARALGVEFSRLRSAAVAEDVVWVANTDADSVVPTHWLTGQLDLAARGAQLVVGSVFPDPEDLPPELLRAWHAHHELRDGHEYIHGANLGFSLAAYRLVGGFPPLGAHEDVALTSALRALGVPGEATAQLQVRTSGRRQGRTPHGFAEYLRNLEPRPPALT